MSRCLPPEVLDLVVGYFHDKPATLKACCLVSKSWIASARRYLFACVKFYSSSPSFESWMKAFPDPSNSPTCYTRSLGLSSSKVLTAAVSDAHPWVHSFHHIVRLVVATSREEDRHISFTRLHGLSPTLQSLQLIYSFAPPSEVINLVCSFPLLENLSLHSPGDLERENVANEWEELPTSPRFTGFLLLDYNDPHITRKLLDLPGGLRFSKVSVSCSSGDADLARELVSKCSDTLESFCITFDWGMPSLLSVVGQYLTVLRRGTRV